MNSNTRMHTHMAEKHVLCIIHMYRYIRLSARKIDRLCKRIQRYVIFGCQLLAIDHAGENK